MERKIAWHEYEQKDIEALELLCQEYIQFLNDGKTERECVVQAVQQAKQAGYSDLDSYIQSGKSLQPGDKVYKVHMGKSIALFNIGTDDIQKGMNLLGAHIDSPRIDIKQNPLYEDSNLAFFDTHYYGGIKKYQWVAMPLALHGVIVKKDGTTIHITIGEKDSEPVFCITDLLPHLGQE